MPATVVDAALAMPEDVRAELGEILAARGHGDAAVATTLASSYATSEQPQTLRFQDSWSAGVTAAMTEVDHADLVARLVTEAPEAGLPHRATDIAAARRGSAVPGALRALQGGGEATAVVRVLGATRSADGIPTLTVLSRRDRPEVRRAAVEG